MRRVIVDGYSKDFWSFNWEDITPPYDKKKKNQFVELSENAKKFMAIYINLM